MTPIRFRRSAVSALALAGAMLSLPAGGATPPADKAADHAEKALRKHDPDGAVRAAELAVSLAPRDAAKRAVLGRAYLAAGRFGSAQTSFRDALALNPTFAGAGMSLALCQIAVGQWDEAHVTLEGLKGQVSETDRGLALALAGDREGSIEVLETAARAEGAAAKTRQNLALAYALDGRWSQARSTAAQDLSGAALDQRMREWAVFSQPRSAWDQVAMLLNVTPVRDAGQPAVLALASPAAPVAVAAAEPVAADPAPPFAEATAPAAEVPAPVAAADPAPAPVADLTPIPVATSIPVAKAIATTIPARDVAPLIAAPVRPTKVSLLRADAPAAWYKQAGLRSGERGRFVVQLGAFAKAGNVETAWTRATARMGRLASFVPSGAGFTVNGATLHRLVLSGFETHAAAARVCGAIKAKGGDCFVRASANEQPLEWAMRKTRTRLASR